MTHWSEAAPDWKAYFRGRRAEMEAESSRDKEPVETEPDYEALARMVEVDPKWLPKKAAQVHGWAMSAGCDVRVGAAPIRRPAQYYAADSAATDNEGNPLKVAGDLKTEERFFTAWSVFAQRRHQGHLLFAFIGQWNDGSFDRYRVHDRVGQPFEAYFDYWKNAPKSDRPQEERQAFEARAQHFDETYNDGESHLVKDYWIEQDGQFKEWLAQWSKILKVEPLPTPKPRAPKRSAEQVMIETGEWVG